MKDAFIGLKQFMNLVKNTKCPVCGKYTLEYKEQIKRDTIYGERPLIIPHLERYIHCENRECWREFTFKVSMENEVITNLELKSY